MPRKRGRPSKKAKLEQEIQEKQSVAQKRVKFDDGGDKVVYQSDQESDKSQGIVEEDGDGEGHQRMGLDDDKEYENVVNRATGKSNISVSI